MTWQEYYKLLEIIVEDYSPDLETIYEYTKELSYIFQNQPEMQTAYKKWVASLDDEFDE